MDPLVIPGAQPLDGGQQLNDAAVARRLNPLTVARRQASRSSYASVTPEEAQKVDGEAFPTLINDVLGGPPPLPAGGSIVGYPSNYAAQIELSDGGHSVLESLAPIAVETAPGKHTPSDLKLGDAGAVFEPRTPTVGVQIPKLLASGVQISTLGLSITPVDAHGVPLVGSPGALDGATVFYANTEGTTDTIAKPTPDGFILDTILRSSESPETVHFKLGLPQGASASVGHADPPASVKVEDGGREIAAIVAPSATDAEGVPVPLSMSLSGGILSVTVPHRQGTYLYPIEVDPETYDTMLIPGENATNWWFLSEHPWDFEGYSSGSSLVMRTTGHGVNAGEWQQWFYPAYGQASVDYIEEESRAAVEPATGAETKLEIVNSQSPENWKTLGGAGQSYSRSLERLCVPREASTCGVGSIAQGNAVRLIQVATKSAGPPLGFFAEFYTANVGIRQETGPAARFNTSEPNLANDAGRENVLYGSGRWLGQYSGAFEVISSDPGLGVNETEVYDLTTGWHKSYNRIAEHLCRGVWCNQSYIDHFTYNDTGMAEGNNAIEFCVENAALMLACSDATVKVDNTPPSGIKLKGIPESSAELNAAPHPITIEATDARSGIKSITAKIDGKEVGAPGGACSPGPCTGSATLTIDGTALGAGEHALEVTATDYANNNSLGKRYTFAIRNAPPLHVGPGSVDPVTGQFALSASDVDIAGAGHVSRSYGSRTTGGEGPLGPEWRLDIGVGQSIKVLPGGNAQITFASGRSIAFASDEKGGFTAPKGDENITLEAKVEGGSVVEYLLKQPTAGTTVRFANPGGTGTWVPVASEGPAEGDITHFYYGARNGPGGVFAAPTAALGRVPAGVSCGKNAQELKAAELQAGCRALIFKYNEGGTTATGENESQWGEYYGRLRQIVFATYNQSTKAPEETAVAEYRYDKQGRLRAEWDPRIGKSPACGGECAVLKTTYGYDANGHVTALKPPGQQPWLVHYGTIASDPSAGRLLSLIRPSAQTPLGSGEAPKGSGAAPTLSSTTPAVGVKISVSSNGSWSGSPLAYTYQWLRCVAQNPAGCEEIPGAVNASYYPTNSDRGYRLRSLVDAVNAIGSVYVLSEPTSAVAEGTPQSPPPEPPSVGSSAVWTVEYQVPLSGTGLPTMTKTELARWAQTEDLPSEATAIFPPDEPMGWPAADYKRATIGYRDSQARTVNRAAPTGGIWTTEYNKLNEVTRTLSADNRATALSAGSKSAEVAEALSTKKVYNAEGTQLIETYGPEHKIRLPNGSEEETRDHQKFSYNEEAPKEEGPKAERYNLVTKTTRWSETTGTKQVLGRRETKISYSGQNNLGWKLRQPTLVSSVTAGQTTTKATTYSLIAGHPIETSASASTRAPVFALKFATVGEKSGQVKSPSFSAVDKSGNVWVSDAGNNRIDEFTASGTFVEAIGWGVKSGASEFEKCTTKCKTGIAGAGVGQFSKPRGIAVDWSTGYVYIADQGNSRIEEYLPAYETWSVFAGEGSTWGPVRSPTGLAIAPNRQLWVADTGNNRIWRFGLAKNEFLGPFGQAGSGDGQLKGPTGIAFSDGNAFVVDSGNNRVEAFTLSGTYLRKFGSTGSEAGQFLAPSGIAADPVSGSLYVADQGNNRVEQLSVSGSLIATFGSHGKENGQLEGPEDVAVNSAGAIYVPDPGNNRLQEFEPLPHAAILTNQLGPKVLEASQLSEPRAVAMAKSGTLLVLDSANGRIAQFSQAGKAELQFGSSGSGAGQMSAPFALTVDSKGNIWVADTGNARIDEFNEKHEFVQAFGFGVLTGEAKPQTCSVLCKPGVVGSEAGQFKEPKGIAVTSTGILWVTDTGNNRVEKFSKTGTFSSTFGWGVGAGLSKLEKCTSGCHAGIAGSGNGQLSAPNGIAISPLGELVIADTGNGRVEQFTESEKYVAQIGSSGNGNGQLQHPAGVAFDPASGNLWVADGARDRLQEFAPAGAFLQSVGDKGSGNGQLLEPSGVTSAPSGAVYVADVMNNRVQTWAPAPRPGDEGAHDTRTVYYGTGAEDCRGRPEWAGLVCRTEPLVQPGVSGPPPLPVTTTTYNTWDEPVVVTEQVGAVTRTTKKEYDPAGRQISSEETTTSPENSALPAASQQYSSETGALLKQTEVLNGAPRTITSVYNPLGQLTAYTDAAGSTTKYEYDVDGRVGEMSDPMGYQIYAHDPTTGFLTGLTDSSLIGRFTASYSVEGKMISEIYPNGMEARYSYNAMGQSTNLEYEKKTHCSEHCVWFSDTEAFGPNGELAYQASTLSTEIYGYDEHGRLSRTLEEPAGGAERACRLYGYDEEAANRTTVTTTHANENGECASEEGVVEGHAYDVAGRPLDPGIIYDLLGNMTKVPAFDAGGSAITSSFYVDNQVAVQEQAEKTLAYSYDPAGRAMVAKMTTNTSSTTTVSHYAAPGEARTWMCEDDGKGECEEGRVPHSTRQIPGLGGSLAAVQTNGETPVLQLADLNGNIVATASDNETETKLVSTHNVTEFGVPLGKAPRYSWAGADGEQSELGTGVITSAGATYVPQLAETLQTEQAIPPGAAPEGIGPGELYQPILPGWAIESGNEAAENAVDEQRAQEDESPCAAAPGECSVEEVEDPTGYHLYAAAKLWQLAKELRGRAGWGDVLSSIFERIPKFGELFKTVQAYTNLLRAWAHNIENCALAIGTTGRCWTVMSGIIVNVLVKKLAFPTFVHVEPCEWVERKERWDWYLCENGAARGHKE
jgi:YD repeat-containing protein